MKTKRNLIQISLLAAGLLQAVVAGFSVHAATITWTNTSGGNWSVANNWSPNQVPTNTDVVLITTPGTYTVKLDINPDFRSFYPTVTLGAGGGVAGVQTLAMTNVQFYSTNLLVTTGGVFTASGADVGFPGQTLMVNGGVLNSVSSSFDNTLIVTNGGVATSTNSGYSIVTVAKGIFNSAADELSALTVASGGMFNESRLAIKQGSSATVASGGVMNVTTDPSAPSSLGVLDSSLINYGTINFTNSGFNMGYGTYPTLLGGIVNQPGGRINLNGTVSLGSAYVYGTTDATYFTNRGNVTQTAGDGSTVGVASFDTSQGTITNLSGTLSLYTFRINLAGTYYAGPGATIQFFGDNVTPGTPFVLNGNGQFQFASGTLYLPTNVIPNLTLVGGYLELGPGFQGGAITNLALDGISLWNNTLPVTGTFAVTNSTLYGNISVASGGVFTATNADAEGSVTVNNGGKFTADSFRTASPMMVAGGGVASLSGTVLLNGLTVAGGGIMNLAGTVSLPNPLTNSGTLNLSNAAISVEYYPIAGKLGGIINQAGGMMSITGSGSTIQYDPVSNSGLEYFINRGNLRLNSPSGTNSINFLNLDLGQGTVTNLAGTAVLRVFQTNLVGTYYAAAGATIQFKNSNVDFVNGYDFNTVTNFATPGTPFVLNGGGDFQFAGGNLYLPTNVPPHLSLVGGILKLGPNFQGGAITNLTFGGFLLTNPLATAFPITGTLTVSNCGGGRYISYNETLPTGVWGNFTVASGGVLHSYSSSFNNNLTVAAGGLVSLVRGSLSVSSSGTLSVANGGTINIAAGGITLFGPLNNAGIINISNPPPAFISGIFSANDGSALYRGGILNQASGIINLADDNDYLSTYNYGKEYLVNQGQIVKTGGTNLSVAAALCTTNSGAITAQRGTIGMEPFTTLPGGSLNVTLNSDTDYGRILTGTNVVLGGAFNVTLANGYVPTNGTTFNVLSYTSYSGNFSSLGLPSAVSWQSNYGSTNFTLVAGSAKPQFGTFNLSGTNLVFTGIGGSPGSNYLVLTSTNLTIPLTNWLALTTNTFDGSGQFHYTNNVNPAKPQQFFIFKSP